MFIKYFFDVLGNCSDEVWMKPWTEVPGSSRDVTANVKAKRDDSGQFAPVIHLSWSQLPDSKTAVQDYSI